MKRNLFLWAAFAVMMALAGCTQKEIVYVEKEDGTGSEMQLEGNVLKIALSNSLTRAARPIYDSEAANNINRIGFKFLLQDGTEIEGITIEQVTTSGGGVTIANEKDKENAQESGEDSSDTDFYKDNIVRISNSDYDTNVDLSVYLNMSAAAGKYIRIIAYGYNDAGTESFPAMTVSDEKQASETHYYGKNLLELSSVNKGNVQEYFAGCTDVAVNVYGLFNQSPEITLERQVAGLLVYLENIPAVVNKTENEPMQVGYITVNAAKTISGLVIPAKAMSADRYSDGNYANGMTNSGGSCELLRFDLRNQKTSSDGLFYEFSNNDAVGGSYTENKVLFADGMDASDFADKEFKNNTLFGSCFILPFDYHIYNDNENSTALYISYLDKEGALIKSVPLHMKIDTGASHSYSIWANHFYSIGYKNGDAGPDSDGDGYPDDGDGNDGDDGEEEKDATGEDDPLDIGDPSGTKVLLLSVNDEWEDVSLVRPTE